MKIQRGYLKLFFIVLFCVLSPMAKLDAQNQVQKNQDYIIEDFILPDGPSGNSINCIVEGPNGYMWYGGHAGLYRYDGYKFKKYASTGGDSTKLAFSYIEWLYWSSDNYLWIGTYGGGLYQFNPDDESFLRYTNDPDDPYSLSNNRVTTIVEESLNILWVGTTNGLNKLDVRTGKFDRFYPEKGNPNSLSFEDVRSLYIDRAGVLWIGTGFIYEDDESLGGLNRYNPDSKTFTRYLHQPDDPTSLSGNLVKSIYEDSEGNFWVGGNGGLQLMDRESGTFQNYFEYKNSKSNLYQLGYLDEERSSVYSILEDRNDNLWVFILHNAAGGNLGSIIIIDPDLKQINKIAERESIIPWQTTQSRDGTIWLSGAGVGSAVHKIKSGNNQIRYLPFNSLRTDDIYIEGIAAQNDSIIWAKITTQDGVPQILGMSNNFRTYGFRSLPEVISPGKNNSGFNTFFRMPGIGLVMDTTGGLWGSSGYFNSGLYNLFPESADVHQYLNDPDNIHSPAENDIRYLLRGSNDKIWLAGQYTISCFDPIQFTFQHFRHDSENQNSLSDAEFFTLFEDNDGYVWIGGNRPNGPGSLDRLDPRTGNVKRVKFPDEFMGYPIKAISQNKNGDILFLTQGKGLHIIFEEILNTELWTTTESPKDYEVTITPVLGNTFQDANNLISDDQGIMWLTDENGKIYRLDSESQSVIEFYDRSDLKFMDRHAFKLNDGNIYFSYQDGLVLVNSASKISDQFLTNNNQLQFTEFHLNGLSVSGEKKNILDKPIWQLSDLYLTYKQSNFGFRFSAFDFRNPSLCQYEVRLLPVEEEWQKIVGEPAVNYFQLPPGDYTLEVKGSDSNGVWYKKEAKINIHISPPWWKSWWAYVGYGLLALVGIYYFDRQQRQRILGMERQKTLEREVAQAKEIEKAYAELKTTQAQLIHAEKMSSLGELTAGIAHEIQNPLNFVNNFSEVSGEMIDEVNEALMPGSGSPDMEEASEILKDLKSNLEKINHHGQRASGIVKSMLDHSRTSSGEKVATDINSLCDEYLRLAYHGMRAKDKNFNASFNTVFDKSLPKIKVIPQDIGRVFLNLINNAFQACADQSVSAVSEMTSLQAMSSLDPKVEVTTKNLGDTIEISISDNGPGIPGDIRDKIFQPFFTTKPTGQGTGLGLSLSYDIIKAHGGTISVDSTLGIGTTFIIQLNFSAHEND
jgi:signal transduction histidine kinase/ligand-binding sensor domain-containing protein